MPDPTKAKLILVIALASWESLEWWGMVNARADSIATAKVAKPVVRQLMIPIGEKSSVKSTHILVNRVFSVGSYNTEDSKTRKTPVSGFKAGWQSVKDLGVRSNVKIIDVGFNSYGLSTIVYNTWLALNSLAAALS